MDNNTTVYTLMQGAQNVWWQSKYFGLCSFASYEFIQMQHVHKSSFSSSAVLKLLAIAERKSNI